MEYLYGFKIPYYANEQTLKSQTEGKKKKLSVKDIITIQWEGNVDTFQINPSFARIPWDE